MDEYYNLWMIQDEEKCLEVIMNYRTFEFLHRHVIAYSDILIRHNLLELFPGKAFILKKGHRSTTGRFGQSGFRRIGESKSRICIDNCLVGIGGTTKPSLTTQDLDDLCFAFLWPR